MQELQRDRESCWYKTELKSEIFNHVGCRKCGVDVG